MWLSLCSRPPDPQIVLVATAAFHVMMAAVWVVGLMIAFRSALQSV
jgi:hypothetical protein